MGLNGKVFNQCVLPAMAYVRKTWSLAKELVKKLETSQKSYGKEMLYVKLIITP